MLEGFRLPCFWGDRKRLESSVHGGQRTVKHRGHCPWRGKDPRAEAGRSGRVTPPGSRAELRTHVVFWQEQVQVR